MYWRNKKKDVKKIVFYYIYMHIITIPIFVLFPLPISLLVFPHLPPKNQKKDTSIPSETQQIVITH